MTHAHWRGLSDNKYKKMERIGKIRSILFFRKSRRCDHRKARGNSRSAFFHKMFSLSAVGISASATRG